MCLEAGLHSLGVLEGLLHLGAKGVDGLGQAGEAGVYAHRIGLGHHLAQFGADLLSTAVKLVLHSSGLGLAVESARDDLDLGTEQVQVVAVDLGGLLQGADLADAEPAEVLDAASRTRDVAVPGVLCRGIGDWPGGSALRSGRRA